MPAGWWALQQIVKSASGLNVRVEDTRAPLTPVSLLAATLAADSDARGSLLCELEQSGMAPAHYYALPRFAFRFSRAPVMIAVQLDESGLHLHPLEEWLYSSFADAGSAKAVLATFPHFDYNAQKEDQHGSAV